MRKKLFLAALVVVCFTWTGCGNRAPSQQEVEAAIRDGSVTVQDALDKGWVTQEWVDNYQAENSVKAANKIQVNAVGAFETQTTTGEQFNKDNLLSTTFLVFMDPQDSSAKDFYNELVGAIEGVRSAGADIVVCNRGSMEDTLFQDAPFTVIAYNDSMKTALARNDEMASGSPCIGVWYVNGSLISAWSSKVNADDLVDATASFVSMSEEQQADDGNDMQAITMG